MKSSKKNLIAIAVVILIIAVLGILSIYVDKIPSPSTYATFWALVPSVVAITLALITKEVYSSLFIGIVIGSVFASGFSFTGSISNVLQDGLIAQLSDSYNVGILIFLVILGTIVALMNKAGGSKAFGDWAATHIKTRQGAQLCTVLLGVLIFIDDYFNCLTVGRRFFDILHLCAVHRHVSAVLGLRVVDCQTCGLRNILIPRLPAVGTEDHMGAVELLHMEP